MIAENRERLIIDSFMAFADRLVDDFDILDVTVQLTEDCATLLDIAAAGLLLADARGMLHLLAATSEQARDVEVFQLQREEGPCLDCYRTGTAVSVADLHAEAGRWPRFAAVAAQQGFASVHAIPIRLRRNVLGAIGLFGTSVGELNPNDVNLAQSLAHVAAIAIAQHHQTRRDLLPEVQSAVISRGIVEVAKGVLAEVHSLEMDEAFARLRGYAVERGVRLGDVARVVVSGAAWLREPLLTELGHHARAPATHGRQT